LCSHRKRSYCILVSIVIVFIGSVNTSAQPPGSLPEAIETLLAKSEQPGGLWIGCELIHAAPELVQLYADRYYTPIWVDDQGPSHWANQMVEVLKFSRNHGLNPEDYHLSCIEAWVDILGKRPQLSISFSELAGLDIVMTDAFVTYGSHLVQGKVDPEKIYPQWVAEKRKSNVLAILKAFSQHKNIEATVTQLAPPHEDYWQLMAAASWLKSIIESGGWPVLTDQETLKPTMKKPSIQLLRDRLQIIGYLPFQSAGADKIYFDSTLEAAVKAFQEDHGLEIDGVVGKQTRRALNISAEERLKQVLLNLERWRWLPRYLGKRYIIVNTAAYTLKAMESDTESLNMKVIVGQSYQKTPVFSKAMTYLIVNPYWNVPPRIARQEILPKLQQDPEYLGVNNFELVAGWEKNSPVMNPFNVDWKNINSDNFPGRIRQKPGPKNALGAIKFMFPNPFHVYLHDTPKKALFKKAKRAFSHGCIRIAKPLKLAVFVLDDPEYSLKHIETLVQGGERTEIGVKNPIPVHLLYWTAWVGESGRLNFREDIYQRDEPLWEALKGLPSGNSESVAEWHIEKELIDF
jgi:murein L,D-transpeptidase YcbB/YkuD